MTIGTQTLTATDTANSSVAGTVGSLSAGVNAIVDALSVYGIRHIDTPCTPFKVWQAIEQAKRRP